MRRLFRASMLIGLILFGLVLWSIDRQRTWEIISGANLPLLAAGMLMTAPEAVFKSLKLRSLVRSQSTCTLLDSLVVYFIGIPFGAVTPGKAGDFVKVYSLSRRAHLGLPESFAIGVLDRLLDLVALIVFGSLGVLLLLVNHSGDLAMAFMVATSAAAIVVTALLLEKGLMARLAKLGKAMMPTNGQGGSFVAALKRAFDSFYTSIELSRKARGALAGGFIFALVASVVISTRTYIFAMALGLGVAWFNFVLLVPLVILIELLPISVLGLGTREYAIISVFAFLGVDREQAVSLSLSAFVLTITPLALTGYLIAWKEHLRPNDVKLDMAHSSQGGKAGE